MMNDISFNNLARAIDCCEFTPIAGRIEDARFSGGGFPLRRLVKADELWWFGFWGVVWAISLALFELFAERR